MGKIRSWNWGPLRSLCFGNPQMPWWAEPSTCQKLPLLFLIYIGVMDVFANLIEIINTSPRKMYTHRHTFLHINLWLSWVFWCKKFLLRGLILYDLQWTCQLTFENGSDHFISFLKMCYLKSWLVTLLEDFRSFSCFVLLWSASLRNLCTCSKMPNFREILFLSARKEQEALMYAFLERFYYNFMRK